MVLTLFLQLYPFVSTLSCLPSMLSALSALIEPCITNRHLFFVWTVKQRNFILCIFEITPFLCIPLSWSDRCLSYWFKIELILHFMANDVCLYARLAYTHCWTMTSSFLNHFFRYPIIVKFCCITSPQWMNKWPSNPALPMIFLTTFLIVSLPAALVCDT